MSETENSNNTNNTRHLVVTDINNILNLENCYGYWQTYLFNTQTEEYEPIYSEFIFYKGKFFDNLESKPWDQDAINNVRLTSNYFNRDNEPICIFRLERIL